MTVCTKEIKQYCVKLRNCMYLLCTTTSNVIKGRRKQKCKLKLIRIMIMGVYLCSGIVWQTYTFSICCTLSLLIIPFSVFFFYSNSVVSLLFFLSLNSMSFEYVEHGMKHSFFLLSIVDMQLILFFFLLHYNNRMWIVNVSICKPWRAQTHRWLYDIM